MDFYDQHFVPNESILMFKAQNLARSRANSAASRRPSLGGAMKVSSEDASLAPIIELYEKHGGDIEKIFADLGDHPGKALKYPPSDAKEFAVKYVEGYYTYIDLKAVMQKAGLEYKEAPPGVPVEEDAAEGQRPLGILRTKLSQPVSELTEDPPDPQAVGMTRSYSSMSSSADMSLGSGATDAAPPPAPPKSDGKKRPPSRQSSKAADLTSAGATSPPSSAPSAASTPRATERYSGYYGGDHGVHGVNQTQLLESRRLKLKKRDRGVPFSTQYPALPLPGPTDDETAPLIALWYDHDGDIKKIFAELGESPRKALKHPPKDAVDFANKFIEGRLTDYASPKVPAGFEEQQMSPERTATPLQALAGIFPSLPHEVLYAVLEAANGSLEGAVNILLESGANLFDDESDISKDPAGKKPAVPDAPAPPAAPPASDSGSAAGGAGAGGAEDVDAGLSAMQQRRLEQEQERADQERQNAAKRQERRSRESRESAGKGGKSGQQSPQGSAPPPSAPEEDFVLAITVPMGSRPNALLKITTTIGTVHARVPPGVKPGQSFFIRMRRGSSQASSSRATD